MAVMFVHRWNRKDVLTQVGSAKYAKLNSP